MRFVHFSEKIRNGKSLLIFCIIKCMIKKTCTSTETRVHKISASYLYGGYVLWKTHNVVYFIRRVQNAVCRY